MKMGPLTLNRPDQEQTGETLTEKLRARLEENGMKLGALAETLIQIPHIDRIVRGDYSDRLIYQLANRAMLGDDMESVRQDAFVSFGALSTIYEYYENHMTTIEAQERGNSSLGLAPLQMNVKAFYEMAKELGIYYEEGSDLVDGLMHKRLDCDRFSYLFNQLARPHGIDLVLLFAKKIEDETPDMTHAVSGVRDAGGNIGWIVDMTIIIGSKRIRYLGEEGKEPSDAIMTKETFAKKYIFVQTDMNYPQEMNKDIQEIDKIEKSLEQRRKRQGLISHAVQALEQAKKEGQTLDLTSQREKYMDLYRAEPGNFDYLVIYAYYSKLELDLGADCEQMLKRGGLGRDEQEHIQHTLDAMGNLQIRRQEFEADLKAGETIFGKDLVDRLRD